MSAMRLALGLLAACHVQPAFAQTQPYIAAEDRVAEPARPIAIIIPQESLATSVELGRVIPAEGGLIGALIDRSPEKLAQSAASKAHEFAEPLREALAGFDATPLAVSATESILSQSAWFAGPAPQVFTSQSMEIASQRDAAEGGDSTVSMTFGIGSFGNEANDTAGALVWGAERDRLEKEFAASNAAGPEVATISWRYQLSPDFTNMQVIADIAIFDPQTSERGYEQQLISVVKLRRPTFVEEDNVAIWAANDGALARRALEMAFARAGEVVPHVLALDEAGYDDATDKKKRRRATGANFSGPQLLRDDKGPVLFAKDGDQRLKAFVAIQTIVN